MAAEQEELKATLATLQSDLETAQKTPGHVLVKSRWVLCNKGDAEHPDMRARLVACEVNKGQKDAAFYASTPPLESKKLLFSQYASERERLDSKGQMQPLRLSFIDIKKGLLRRSATKTLACDPP